MSGDASMPGPAPASDLPVRRVAVAIVGGGPAGLRAAAELAGRVAGEVLVLEREAAAGGIPRHSDHPGYGIRDMGRFVSGPRYAGILRERAMGAGATILCEAMATGWAGERTLEVTSPGGRLLVEAGAVVLATGARERPRAARLIPGDRGRGVYTTGQLQNLVHVKHRGAGRRAVVVGAELVSWSALLTLRHAGCRTVALVSEHPRPESYALFHLPGRILFRTRVETGSRVTRIIGRSCVEGVEVEDLVTGRRRVIDCDTVILTGDWIPDNELARSAGLVLDPGTLGPEVDSRLGTSRPGVFAAGNVLHPVDTADIAALDGAAVAGHVVRFLGARDGDRNDPAEPGRLGASEPFTWVSPQRFSGGDARPPRGRLLLWSGRYVRFPLVVLRQGGAVVARRRVWWPAAPGRVFRVPAAILRGIDWAAGPVTIGIDTPR